MTDRPILFSAPMVRALLAGTKTQTRRILKPLPNRTVFFDALKAGLNQHQSPRFASGDRLWVKEKYLPDPPADDPAWHDNVCTFVEWSGCGSKVSDVPPCLRQPEHAIYAADPKWEDYEMRWRPSIHMPRWASRLTLMVTDVRVQRLQDISEADAIAEGCFKGKASGRVFTNMAAMYLGGDAWANGRDWYADVWEEINGAGAWDANPWVAAYTFTVHPCNIDKIGGAA